MVYLILQTFDFEPLGKTYLEGEKNGLDGWKKEQISSAIAVGFIKSQASKKTKKNTEPTRSEFDKIVVENKESEDGENSSS